MRDEAEAQRLRAAARRIADDVLFPAALEVDRAERVPASHLDLLAAEGFYGMAVPPDGTGDLSLNLDLAADLVQTLASGCLTTAFVFIQHHGCVTAVAREPALRQRWLAPLARGEVRGGVALAGLRAATGRTRVQRTGDGFVIDGEAPWVSGWDMIDVVHVGAVDDAGTIHFLLVDAVASSTLTVTPVDLVAARASRTVTLRFAGHVVGADRLTGTMDYDQWRRDEAYGSALNGFLALGVAQRCALLLGPAGEWLDTRSSACRTALLSGDPAAIPPARAAAADLALRAAAALAVYTGSRSLLPTGHPQRLLREAEFLLVFGSRPAIRDALLSRLIR